MDPMPKVQDYYDMDPDLLPSANFAGRPVSEIFMLDGLWSPMDELSPISEADEITPITRLRSELLDAIKAPQPSIELPSGVDTPRITVTSPPDDTILSERGGLNDDKVKALEPRSSMKKARTAPPGSLNSQEFVPVEPRRANSARIGYSGTKKGRRPQAGSEEVQDSAIGEQAEIYNKSFSQKARVKKALESKHMDRLQLSATDDSSESCRYLRNSILQTPKDLYGFVHPNTSGSSSTPDSSEMRSTTDVPSQDLLRPGHQVEEEPERDNVAKDACQETQQRVYLAGEIVVEKTPAHLQTESVAANGPLNPGVNPAQKNLAELVDLDDVVIFFEDFEVAEEPSDMCLDKYWVQKHELRIAKPLEVPSTAATAPESPTHVYSPRASRFSFSSTSSAGSEPSGGRAKRQRIRLRKLLSIPL